MDSEGILKRKLIRIAFIALIAVVIIAAVLSIMLKYEVEGETNMPFELTKMIVVSSAEGVQKENATALWDLEIVQNNDVYISIAKNLQYKETALIEEISIENIKIVEAPAKGNLKFYRPTVDAAKSYEYKEEYVVNNGFKYVGGIETNMKNLEVANQGGLISFRISTKELSSYTSNEDGEVIHDGRILEKTGIKLEEVKAKVAFDIVIKVKDGNSYKGTVNIEVPTGDIIKEGTSSIEKTVFKDVIFKRN